MRTVLLNFSIDGGENNGVQSQAAGFAIFVCKPVLWNERWRQKRISMCKMWRKDSARIQKKEQHALQFVCFPWNTSLAWMLEMAFCKTYTNPIYSNYSVGDIKRGLPSFPDRSSDKILQLL